MLTERKVYEILKEFEEKHSLFDLIEEGVSPWQILRFSIACKIQKLPLDKAPIPRAKYCKALIEGLKFWKLLSLKGTRFLCFSYYSGSRVKTGMKYEDVWFDSILESVNGGKKIIQMNVAGYEDHIANNKIPAAYDITLLVFISSALAKLLPIKSQTDSYVKIAEVTNRSFVDVPITKGHIQKKVSQVVWMSRIYTIILKWIRPRACLVADTGEFALLIACKNLEIRSIELQHGIFSRFHPHILPEGHRSKFPHLLLPGSIAVYGEFWKSELKGSDQFAHNIIHPIGNALLEKYRPVHENFIKGSELFSMVLTTQGLDRRELIQFLSAFLLASKDSFNLTLKLHPAYDPDSSVYDELTKDPRIRIVSGLFEPNTFDLIARSNLHLSIASACHYDALSIGTMSCVLNLPGHELMDSLIKGKEVFYAEDPLSLSHLVSTLINNPETNENSNKFCSPDFKKNIQDLLS